MQAKTRAITKNHHVAAVLADDGNRPRMAILHQTRSSISESENCTVMDSHQVRMSKHKHFQGVVARSHPADCEKCEGSLQPLCFCH